MSTFNDIEILDTIYGITTTKGDIIVNNGIKNTRLPVGTDNYALIADSNETTGLKWAPLASSNNIDYSKIILSTVPISSNNTNPVTISQFNTTPVLGSYLILYNLTISLSKINSRNVTFGIYKNGTLISNSVKIIEGYSSNSRMLFCSQYVTSFNGTDDLSIRFNTNNTDTTVTIYEGSLFLLKVTNVNQYVSDTLFSTNSTIPIIISDMNNTPANGLYLILFNATFALSRNNANISIGLYKNGTLITGSNRTLQMAPNVKNILQLQIDDSFSGSDNLTVRVSSSATNNNVFLYERSLILLEL